jgi:hypothetical protein
MRIRICLILCITLFIGCEKLLNQQQESWPIPNQLVLFQVEYNNFAWGYQHNGYLIDSSGLVRSFSLPKNWHLPDSLGFISETSMNENISQLDTGSFYVDKNELLENYSKIKKISEGVLSKPKSTGADLGETDYSGYVYDATNNRYKRVLIKRSGDWTTENSSPEAEEVYKWLIMIRSNHR